MSTVPRSVDDLEAQLRAQYGFLRRSAHAFDHGAWDEAARLATTVRVLVHDTRHARSLLGQLGLKHNMEFEDSAAAPPGLARLGDFGGRPAWLPLLGSPARRATFEQWWKCGVIQAPGEFVPDPSLADRGVLSLIRDSPTGRLHSRRSVVLAMADQDGGAHVDPAVDAAYADLCADDGGSAWADLDSVELPERLDVSQLNAPLGNIAQASVRQVAHEITLTLERVAPRIVAP